MSAEQHFVARGKNVFRASDRGDEIPHVPAGFYVITEHPMMGIYLRRLDDFTLPEKLYGTAEERATKIMTTFVERTDKTTGVLLSGNKGSGKSLLAKKICVDAVASGMPVIVLDQPMAGPAFEDFLNSIKQPCVVMIDEFEKKYKDDDMQNALLSLLDGTGVGQKMYLLTSNSADVSTYLLNRPSRIFYHYQYKKLEEGIMLGYCADKLQDAAKLKKVQTLWALSTDMSFDILQSLVEELNRYPEVEFLDILEEMNINMAGQFLRRFRLKHIIVNGDRVRISEGQNSHIHLVHFQDGDSQIGVTAYIPLEMQLAMKSGMKSDEFYFYNHEEEKELNEKGTYDHDDVTEEFPMRLRYEEGSTFITSEAATFHRKWGTCKVEIRLEAEKKDMTRSALEKLFGEDA